jgi:hypothetical protein
MLTILSVHWINGILYLDPGSGSFLLQLLIGVLMGGALALKIYWRRLVAFFNKDKTQPAEDSNDLDDEQ